MFKEYAAFCYSQIGSYTLDYLDYFQDLRPQISKANLGISLPEYVSMMLFTSAIAAVFGLFTIGGVLTIQSGISGMIFGVAIAMVVGVAVIIGFYLYPQIMIRRRSSKIKDKLPFATMYLSTLAGTGTSVPRLFHVLSNVEEYGEITKEAEKINRDIETFNMDASEALKRAAERTPNREFKELMWGMNHIMTSGGSLRSFLQERADRLMDDYRRQVEEFADQLSLLVEMYITVVVVGSIIFTTMSVVMSTLSSNVPPSLIVTVQMMAIFLGLPIISGMFILLVSGLAPGGIR
jgi:archaellum biogenesis protein FlaJ (TadC family)